MKDLSPMVVHPVRRLAADRWLGLAVTALVTAGLVTSGCEGVGVSPEAMADADASVGMLEQGLWTKNGPTVPSDMGAATWTWSTHDIEVCWSAETAARSDYAQVTERVRTWIEDTYGRVTDLRFHGWVPCNPVDKSGVIRIYIWDRGAGITHQFSKTVNVEVGPPSDPNFQAVLMHEFAHALGFDHEFRRPDATGTCGINGGDADPRERTGNYVTPYDPMSIMNSTYCGYYTALSGWDIVGLQRVYGRKPYQSMVGYKNKCLDIDNSTGSSSPSSKQTQLWDCFAPPDARNKNMRWSYGSLGAHTLGNPNYYRGMLDVQWGKTADGTPTWNYFANGAAAQQWKFEGVELRGMGDRCLTVPADNLVPGQQLAISTCTGAKGQKWTLEDLGSTQFRIRSTASLPALCIQSDAATTRPKLAYCSTSGAQILRLDHGQITAASGTCFDVYKAKPLDGTAVQTYRCRSSDDALIHAQLWNTRGPLRGLAGKCLDADINTGAHTGTKTQLWTCNGKPQQIWEWHF
jgi:Ricin-type beta-trefoil lectin domain/Ricin-type beta-trefoil lectin domain-like